MLSTLDSIEFGLVALLVRDLASDSLLTTIGCLSVYVISHVLAMKRRDDNQAQHAKHVNPLAASIVFAPLYLHGAGLWALTWRTQQYAVAHADSSGSVILMMLIIGICTVYRLVVDIADGWKVSTLVLAHQRSLPFDISLPISMLINVGCGFWGLIHIMRAISLEFAAENLTIAIIGVCLMTTIVILSIESLEGLDRWKSIDLALILIGLLFGYSLMLQGLAVTYNVVSLQIYIASWSAMAITASFAVIAFVKHHNEMLALIDKPAPVPDVI